MKNGNSANVKVIYIDDNETFDRLVIQKVSMVTQYNLTEKEYEVLKLMVDGINNKNIGEILYISKSTVKAHISNICQKLKVENRIQAVRKVTELGLV